MHTACVRLCTHTHGLQLTRVRARMVCMCVVCQVLLAVRLLHAVCTFVVCPTRYRMEAAARTPDWVRKYVLAA